MPAYYQDWWRPGMPAWMRYPVAQVPRPGNRESFVTVQRFLAPVAESHETHIGPLYFDFDGELSEVAQEVLRLAGFLEEFYDLPPEAVRLYFTGNRGIHVEVAARALGAKPDPELTYVYRAWAHSLADSLGLAALDRTVYSERRMWRQVGSRHPKTGLYKVEVAPAQLMQPLRSLLKYARRPAEPLPYPLPSLVPSAAEALQEQVTRYKEKQAARPAGAGMVSPLLTVGAYCPPCIDRLLGDYWPGQGVSNHALMLLAGWLRSTGADESAAVAFAGEWLAGAPANLFHSAPHDRAREAQKVVHSIYAAGRSFGCQFARVLGLCDPARCQIAAEVRREAVARSTEPRGQPRAWR